MFNLTTLLTSARVSLLVRETTSSLKTPLMGAIVALAMLNTTGCSKSEKGDIVQSKKGGVTVPALLGKVPSATNGFFYLTNVSDGAKRYQNTPWFKLSSNSLSQAQTQLQQLDPQARESANAVVDLLSETGIFFPNAEGKILADEAVAFVAFRDGKPEAGAVAKYKDAQSAQNAVASVRASLEKLGKPLTEKSIGGKTGYISADPANEQFGGILQDGQYLYIAASIGGDPLAGLVGVTAETSWAATAASDTRFQAATKGLATDGAFALGYLDGVKALSNAKAFLDAETAAVFEKVPLDSLAYAGGMSGSSYQQRGQIDLLPKSPTQKEAITSLASASANMFAFVPQSALVLVGLDGALLRAFKDVGLESIPDEAERSRTAEQMKILDDVSSVSIGVRRGAPGAMFPELVIGVGLAKGSTTGDLLLTMAKGLISQTGQALQQKSIQGTDVSYLLTPFGAGVYLASTDRGVVAATTEAALTEILGSPGSAEKFSAGLTKTAQSVLSGKSNLVLSFINFTSGVETFESLQSGFSMFTGGQPIVPKESIDPYRDLGSTSSSVRLEGNRVIIEAVSDLPAKK